MSRCRCLIWRSGHPETGTPCSHLGVELWLLCQHHVEDIQLDMQSVDGAAHTDSPSVRSANNNVVLQLDVIVKDGIIHRYLAVEAVAQLLPVRQGV